MWHLRQIGKPAWQTARAGYVAGRIDTGPRPMTTLLGISGSLRRASHNTKLLQIAAESFGCESYTLADIDLPLYNGDVEEAEGIPAKVQALAALIGAADAVLIATPEYNKGMSGALKNALDWLSRVKPAPLAGKPVAIMSASAGISGGARAQYALRLALVPFDARVLNAPEVLVGASHDAFDADGGLKADTSRDFVARQMTALRALL